MSNFDTNATTDPTGYNLSFDNETELGPDGYIVRSVAGPSLEIVGGTNGSGGENDAIDVFLQSLGMQIYGASDNYASSDVNVWQITPSMTTLTGSWDIRSSPSIGYLNDTGGSGGWGGGEGADWKSFYWFNYGGGSPEPEDTQADNVGYGASAAHVEAHPDWWSQVTTNVLDGTGTAASVMPLGTVNVGDTFSITLTLSTASETLTITANSSDDTPSGIANALYSAILADANDASLPYFESSSITVTTNSELNTNSTTLSYNNPVVEFYPESSSTLSFTLSTEKNSTVNDPNFLASVYKDGELNFTNANLVNYIITNYVAPWVASDPTPGSMLAMSPRDGSNYDKSQSTIGVMDSNNPFQTSDISHDWQGYNQNGVLVDADSQSYWALMNAAAKYVLQNEAPGEDLYVGGLAYDSTSQPPSFPLEPNIFIEVSQIFQDTPYTIDEQLKIDKNRGGETGLYMNWDIYLEGYYGNPVPSDVQPNNVTSEMEMFVDDHVFELGGEDAIASGAEMPGVYMAGLLTGDIANANATTMQNALTAYYNSSFGPAATAMEDYTVMFIGSAADPSLASPPAMVTFSGLAYGAFGETGSLVGEAAIANDNLALQESFGYLNTAETALTTAYNSGHNASFTTVQFNADQARVEQIQMYNQFLFLEWKLESDYYNLGVNTTPAVNSASFNLILNDLTNVAVWVDDLSNTDLVNTENFDVNFQAYTFHNLKYFWSNDPNGSNGLLTEGKGLLKLPAANPDPTPTATTLNADWSSDEAILAISAPPTSLAATVVSPTENDLTWTNTATSSDAQTGLNIYRAVNSGGVPGVFSLLTSVGASVTSYHDTTAINGTTYWYEVQSFNTSGDSIFDGPIEPSASTLTAPTALGASTASTSEIDLSWENTNSIQTGVYVDRSSDGISYTTIATLGATATTYSDAGLTDGSEYYYEVQSFDATSTSGNSNVATAVTELAAPTGLSATTASPSQINLSWTNNSATQTGFDIDRSTDDATWVQIDTVSSSASSFTDTALTADTTFYYEVQAYNTIAGGSAFSNVASAATSSSMAAPSNLIATAASTTQINLTWTDHDGGSATGYDIDQSTTGYSGWTQIATVGSGYTAYTNAGLTDGTQYFYEVQAFNGSTTSGFSIAANAVTALAAPSGLTAATASTSQINLTWTDNDASVATAYDIDRSTTSTGGFTQIATVGAGITAYTNSGLTDGTKYFYEVDAVDSVTTSAFSNIANAVTQLAAPSGLIATAASAGEINLTWTNNSIVATGVDIDRSTNGTSFTQIATVSSTTTSYHDTNVFPSTEYCYEVRAVDGSTTSAFSSIANATPPTNEVGGVVTDDFYGTNGSAWSSQWSFINQLTIATASDTISGDDGLMTFTRNSGDYIKSDYNAYINTTTMQDSFQSVLFETNDKDGAFGLFARSDNGGNNYYKAYADLDTNKLDIDVVINQTATTIAEVDWTGNATDTWFELEFEVVTVNSTTTDLYAKIWATTATEPTTWSLSTSDTTSALQGVSAYEGMVFYPYKDAASDSETVSQYELVNIVSTNASYIDNFENASTTGWSPLTASRWSVGTYDDTASYYINTSSFAEGANSTLGEYSLLDAGGYTNIGDFTLTVNAAAAMDTASSNYAIVFGYQNSNNYYFMLFSGTSGDTALYKVVGGAAPSLIATATGGQITNTSYNLIEIKRKGTSISVWYNGDSILTTSDATFIGGQIGLGALNDAAYFDNVIVG